MFQGGGRAPLQEIHSNLEGPGSNFLNLPSPQALSSFDEFLANLGRTGGSFLEQLPPAPAENDNKENFDNEPVPKNLPNLPVAQPLMPLQPAIVQDTAPAGSHFTDPSFSSQSYE